MKASFTHLLLLAGSLLLAPASYAQQGLPAAAKGPLAAPPRLRIRPDGAPGRPMGLKKAAAPNPFRNATSTSRLLCRAAKCWSAPWMART
jgi:hypothetical protein